MRAQSPVGANIPATMTVRTAIEVAVLCITSLKLYLKLDEMHKPRAAVTPRWAAARDCYLEPFPSELKLALKRLINFLCIEPHDDRTVNDDHGSGHVTKLLKIGQGARILRYVSLLKLYTLLRKILLRLVAEHSSMLGINDDVLPHSPPPVLGVPFASNRWIDSFAPLITSRTGLSE
jgi:hypothetical protein